MAKTKKVSPEETLRALYNLQVIDSKIDKMLNRLDFTKNIGSNCYQKSTSSLFDTILKET